MKCMFWCSQGQKGEPALTNLVKTVKVCTFQIFLHLSLSFAYDYECKCPILTSIYTFISPSFRPIHIPNGYVAFGHFTYLLIRYTDISRLLYQQYVCHIVAFSLPSESQQLNGRAPHRKSEGCGFNSRTGLVVDQGPRTKGAHFEQNKIKRLTINY